MKQDSVKQNYVQNDFYKLNRIFLSVVSLWPYDNETIFVKINRIFTFIMSLSVLFVQLTTLFTYEFSINFIIMLLSDAIPGLLCILQYCFFYINLDKVKEIWECICEDYNALKDETEREIIQRYSQISTQWTIRISVILTIFITAYSFVEISPIILDIMLPLVETRPRNLHVLTEYFIDSQKYFCTILFHWLTAIFLNAVIIISTCMFQSAYTEHICGLLKVSCYRFKHLMNKYVDVNQMDDRMIVQKISGAVQMHRRALEHAAFWISTFATCTTVGVILMIASLSFNLFQFLSSITVLKDVKLIATTATIIIGHLIIMFLGSNYGQNVTNHHDEIFENACNVQWYKASTNIQKLLLFILVKTRKVYTININNIFVGSLETFTKITSLSISYFTLLQSLMK